MKWLALDIGGANLKAADGQNFAALVPFPLWKKPKQLAEAIRALVALAPPASHLVATMTGELADCFATKAEGVAFIVDALKTAADGRHTRIYLTDGRLVAPTVALKQPLLAAAANWHALARFAGRLVPKGSGMLIDIGSTTCDIIPLVDGAPVTIGKTDPHRLANGEMVYTGVERSPVCAVLGAIPWHGRKVPAAQELFATMADVYLTLGELPEEPTNRLTADGRPATKAAARDRLARCICADREMFSEADARALSLAAARAQTIKIAHSAQAVLTRLPRSPAKVVLSGSGEFLARRVLEKLALAAPTISLSEELGPELSRCAAAHALAVLAREGS